jgi:uncharacterized membrane protein YqaE (UPF0057 family)
MMVYQLTLTVNFMLCMCEYILGFIATVYSYSFIIANIYGLAIFVQTKCLINSAFGRPNCNFYR